jgi:TetR/AcrR family transcriptional repressor of nem operon
MKQPRTDMRQHILATGEAIIAGKGFSAVGLAEILAAAKVPKGSFYHYFESKEQFGQAMLEAYFADYLVRLQALLSTPAGDARTRLMAYWERWAEVQGHEQDPRQCLVVKLSAEVSDLSEAMRGALRAGTTAVLEHLAGCLGAGVQDGSIPAGLDCHATAHALYQLWLGASLLVKVHRSPAPFAVAMATTRAWLGFQDPA